MSTQDLLSQLRERGLTAWQADFVVSFVKAGSSPFHILSAPPGAGKARAGTSLVGEIARGRAKRILVLTPAALCFQWTDRLITEDTGMPVSLVNRKTYRELQAASLVGDSPWDAGGIFVLSDDFASQDDIASSLGAIGWDLVIYDERIV